MTKYLWKIGGEAGFGIMTVGLSFSKIASRSGYHIFDYAEYPSLIRGGHNTYEVLISDEQVGSSKKVVDLLVCLNKDTYEFHKSRLTAESVVVYDPDDFEFEGNVVKVQIPFKKIKREHEIFQIMVNTIAIGASLGLLGADIEILRDIIRTEFQRKGQQVIDFNLKFADIGYNYITEHYSQVIRPILTRKQTAEKVVAGANDMFSLGAVAADCRFYSAYPMTPSSSVLTSLAAWQQQTGMVVRHSEDEIAVINNALGAAHAGVRSAVGTSGGGFALMVETLSYAGVAEIPVVVFLGQRPGPATGMPTWTEQGDLLFTCHAGHGEFPKIVFAPGDINEMLELTMKAFDMADIYQVPVIVMSDKLIGESHTTYDKSAMMSFVNNYKINRGKTVRETSQEKYLRYKLSDDGISERLIPGQKGHFYQANSYEHVEDSHTTEDGRVRIEQVEKRNKKQEVYLKTHFSSPTVFGSTETSDICFVSWGGNKGAIIDAQKMLEAENIKSSFIHFTHIYPLNESIVKPLFEKNKRYILVENNSHAQFGKLLRMETGVEIKEKILKYDGRPIFPEDIVTYIKKSTN